MSKKLFKFAKRCPKYRNSFESIKNCVITVEKGDGSSQTIHTQPAFLVLEKNERLADKVRLLAETVCGLQTLVKYDYQIS